MADEPWGAKAPVVYDRLGFTVTEMEPVIGLEIHAQLKTKTKLFCSCPIEPGAEPNTNICEVCTGQPGALPRMNEKAIELAAMAGLALGSKVNSKSLFSRKNYFYPDLPNGFQTSQLDPPICQGGAMDVDTPSGPKTIRLNRIHLEDDAGKCVHDEKRGRTLVDLNRAGTPLIEIVTEPDLNSPAEAIEFLKKLHALLVRLGVTEGRMEEGEFRCDVNVSLRPKGSTELGVRGEIKNLNSFRFAGQAIEYEIKRQSALYAQGQSVLQETLHFDPAKRETRTLRTKEEAHDYRYFPQPDLPPVRVSEELLTRIRESMPASVEETNQKLLDLGLREDLVTLFMDRKGAPEYLQAAQAALPDFNDAKKLAAVMAEFLLPACQKADLPVSEAPVTPQKLAKLASLMDKGTIGRRAAQELFPLLFQTGADPEELAKEKGLIQISDKGALSAMAAEVVALHPQEVAKYRDGQEKVLSFLVGQLMRKSRGAADPKGAGQALIEAMKG
ncbi:MAG: Asp-tRNA(Asn)/Glu-tRNA(Gln) amidotransferase subunit GatB [Deltaproteobacteria bacterium]|jgi:aspartyl-tRNA(Asn)/glutamyl-tRNA(Gln) amidotransferase subunit B|nr:Asp-tRNA(Asn)/Glu-tRNA(Gln) amidotransferase subunit GatB [Deltaproteobacteria bacterium]